MFEDEIESKTYNLFISQIPDSDEEYNKFTGKLNNAYNFAWKEHSIKEKTSKNELKEPDIRF